jgi:DNA helicase-2/ATP-dependent DNA helicase PcrA
MTDPAVWEEELSYLAVTARGMDSEMKSIYKRLTAGLYTADDAAKAYLSVHQAEESILRLLETRYRGLTRSVGNPYFARIDFTANDGKYERAYIGKTSVYDNENNLLVTDWRAPISTLYYDSRIGNAEYISPDGLIQGELSLKRRFKVSGCELLEIDDIDVTATDEMLAPFLSVTSDVRLKNIIATIQAGQNGVIRANMRRPLIVQGAAGSGKTWRAST